MYDVLVIGAGPAGSAAAYHASRQGMRVLLIDRVPFPRHKTCGDLLAPRALAAIARMGITDLPGYDIRGCWIIHEARKQRRYEDLSTHVAPHVGRVLGRDRLDDILRARACAAGAEWDVATAQRLVWKNGQVTGAVLQTARGVVDVRARCVIAATGAARVTELVGATTRPQSAVWGVAGRIYLTVNDDLANEIELYIPLSDHDRLLYGSAWIFPTGARSLNVGLGLSRSARSKGLSVRSLLEAFLTSRVARDPRFATATRCGRFASAPIAVTVLAEPQPGLLPVGDLAGVANPFTGEGITAALESGELAADAALAAGENAADEYKALMRERMASRYALRPALASLYAHPWQYFERGLDLVMVPGHSVGDVVRQLVWDDAPARPPHFAALSPSVIEVTDRVRNAIIRIGKRPLLRQTLQGLVEQADVRFGWYAAFVAAVQASANPHAPLSAHAFDAAVTLEILNLIGAAHHGIVPNLGRRKNNWGRNTLSLLVADTLAAHALKMVYAMDAGWCRWLSVVASQALRRRAAQVSTKQAHVGERGTPADLFIAAAFAGLATTPSPRATTLPPAVHHMATTLAAMKDGTATHETELAALRRMLADDHGAWHAPLTNVLEALALQVSHRRAGVANVEPHLSSVSDAGA